MRFVAASETRADFVGELEALEASKDKGFRAAAGLSSETLWEPGTAGINRNSYDFAKLFGGGAREVMMALDGEWVCAVRWDGAWQGGKDKGRNEEM